MRILYLTNGFPYPLTSGYLRHYFLIRDLAKRHSITLVSIVNASFSSEHIAGVERFTERVVTCASAEGSGTFARKAAARLGSILGRREGSVREMCRGVKRLMREHRFDVVLLSGKQTVPVLECLDELPVVVDMCDATSLRIRGSMSYARPVRLPLLVWNYVQVRRAERRLAARAAHLVFASCRDREAIVNGSGEQATVIPNGIDLDYWRRSTTKLGRDTIVLTGAMNYPPNTDAALYLIEEILPRVRQSVPAARAFVVGRDPTPRLVRAGRRAGVTVTGFVEDVRPYLEQAGVFAAPLRFGAGIQNKVLEAMAMGVPAVVSPLAAEGLRTEQGETPPLATAASAREFAERLTERLVDAVRDDAPDQGAREFVERNFVWSRSAEKLERVLFDAAGQTQ